MIKPSLKFALALAAVSLTAWAQVTGSISGRIQDQTGGTVGGATVTVKSLETGATRTTTADNDGNYRLLSVPVGPTEIRVEKMGFKTTVRSGVDLAVTQEAVVNFALEVGEIAQAITVTGEAPVVNTTTNPVFGIVGERQIKDLPLNGRSFDSLVTLNSSALNYALKSPNTSTSNGATFAVAGRRPLENIFLLNGIEYTGSSQLSNTPGGVSGQLLGVEAVREFNVLTDNYSAEYGKRAGAQVNVVTQSGSNVLHGSVFEFLRNNKLDAPNYFDPGAAPPFKRNQFGASLGGPIKRDKIFLFGNYEGFQERLAVSSRTVVPNLQSRQGNIQTTAGGPYTPAPNLDRRMLPFFEIWPLPNGEDLGFGAAYSYNNPRRITKENFGTLRGDYVISDRDTFTASYTIDDGDGILPLADPLFAANSLLRSHVGSVSETHVFSPRVLNTFRAGISRAAYNFNSALAREFPQEVSFVAGPGGPGGITIGGTQGSGGGGAFVPGGSGNAANVSNRRNLFTYTDTLSINTGRHQVNAGVWFQRMQVNENSGSRRLGQATFTSMTTFLQGVAANFQVLPNPSALSFRSWFGAWFIDDVIRVRRNLTMQIGLRHEFTTGWGEPYGRAGNWITDANGVLMTEPRVANNAFTENNAKKLFSPRVSLAWDVFGNGKTAIRTGYGMYYTLIDNLSFLLNQIPPHNGSVAFENQSIFNYIPVTRGVQPPAACSATQPRPCTTYAPQGVQPDAKTQTVQNWNFSIEQQLSRDMSLRVAYVGSFGYHGLISIDPNSIPAQVCTSPAGCIAGGVAPAANRTMVPQGAQYTPVGLRPNPYITAGFFWYSQGNTSYNALQTEVSRRLGQGLQFRGNFTWAKNLDHNSALTIAQGNNQPQMVMNRNDLRRDWGPSALDVRTQGTISAHYELPFGAGKRWLSGASGAAEKILGGWQANTIVTMLSGFPFTPLAGSNRSGDGNTRNPDRPHLNPNFTGPLILGQPTRWYNPAAFVLPAVGTWGSLGRGILRGPGLGNVDLSIIKNARLSERVNLQFRTEFFNLTNRANFASPNQNVFAGPNVSPSAGVITYTTTTARQIQFGLKLMF